MAKKQFKFVVKKQLIKKSSFKKQWKNQFLNLSEKSSFEIAQ